jgi:hypothetical protein
MTQIWVVCICVTCDRTMVHCLTLLACCLLALSACCLLALSAGQSISAQVSAKAGDMSASELSKVLYGYAAAGVQVSCDCLLAQQWCVPPVCTSSKLCW